MAMNNNLKTRAMYAHEIIEKEAREEGKKEGLEEGLKKSVIALWQNDIEPYMVANFLNLEIEQVERFIAEFKNEKMGNKNGNE
jgi:predicted transposase YdaD